MALSVEMRLVLTEETLAVGSMALATLSTAMRSSSLCASRKSISSNFFATWLVSYRKIGIVFLSLAA